MNKRNYKPQHQDNSWMGKVYLVGVILLLLGMLLALNGCSTTRYVDREVVIHDTTRVVKVDSIWN